MKVIGVNGYARAGKDTVGAILTEHHGYERRAFADKLREFALAANPIIPVGSGPMWQRLADLVGMGGWELAKEIPEVRRYLQALGTEGGRKVLGEDVWVDAAMRDLREPESIHVWQSEEKVAEVGGCYVFTDCRFPNEAQAVKDLGGEVWRVHRPGVMAANGHHSETALDDWTFDAHLFNESTIDDLRGQVGVALGEVPPWVSTLASDLPVDVITGDGPAPTRKVN